MRLPRTPSVRCAWTVPPWHLNYLGMFCLVRVPQALRKNSQYQTLLETLRADVRTETITEPSLIFAAKNGTHNYL